MAPGSAMLADHPKTVNLREDLVVESINGWIGRLFAAENVDQTVAELVGSQGSGTDSGVRDAAKLRLSDAEARLKRFQAAIAAGVDPSALVDAVNRARAERAAARAEVDSAPAGATVTDADVYAMIDSLGDVGGVLADAKPAGLSRLYRRLNLELRYEPERQAVYVTACPGVDSACVRGGSCTLTTRLRLRDIT
jgi:hypothetical protein